MKKLFLIIMSIIPLILIAGPSATGVFLKSKVERPGLPFYLDSEHFRVWYDTTGNNAIENIDTLPENGIPDYAEKTLAYLEESWQKQCIELGFNEPFLDSSTIRHANNVGGNDNWDVYIVNMGSGYYGGTATDESMGRNKSTGFIQINSRLRDIPRYEDDPYQALAVTCAHEFQHMIQFTYNNNRANLWQMECTATLMEEVCYDDVNDYYAYLPYYLDRQSLPLYSHGNAREYGSVIWPIYLVERHGVEIIRRWWELTDDSNMLTGIREALVEFDSDMDSEYAEFCRWNMMIGSNAIEGHGYSEAPNYPLPLFDEELDIDLMEAVDTTIGMDIDGPYACKHLAIPIESSLGKYSLRRNLDGNSGVYASIEDISYENSWNILVSGIFPDGSESVPYDASMENAFLGPDSLRAGIKELWPYDYIIVSPISLFDSGVPFNLKITADVDPIETAIDKPYPNPVQKGNEIYFPFFLSETSEILLIIYDASGMPVYKISEVLHSGPHRKFPYWKTEDIASGLYHYKLILPEEEQSGMIIVK
ncbi:MAG: T9SS type A sorting domain-containing protein [Candidatus Zixiibacteriota bacterium]